MGRLITITLAEVAESAPERQGSCVVEAGLAGWVVGYMWGRRVRMSEGDSMPSRPRDPSRRKIVSAFEHTGFQASYVIIKPAAE